MHNQSHLAYSRKFLHFGRVEMHNCQPEFDKIPPPTPAHTGSKRYPQPRQCTFLHSCKCLPWCCTSKCRIRIGDLYRIGKNRAKIQIQKNKSTCKARRTHAGESFIPKGGVNGARAIVLARKKLFASCQVILAQGPCSRRQIM